MVFRWGAAILIAGVRSALADLAQPDNASVIGLLSAASICSVLRCTSLSGMGENSTWDVCTLSSQVGCSSVNAGVSSAVFELVPGKGMVQSRPASVVRLIKAHDFNITVSPPDR
ncbi:hypothetical protein [Photorhabdus akhurstii]|uniref:hypothetical protein n=1 Tax=Photorhabdus akhurstii TaxID=171438 RepID=UPI002156FF91